MVVPQRIHQRVEQVPVEHDHATLGAFSDDTATVSDPPDHYTKTKAATLVTAPLGGQPWRSTTGSGRCLHPREWRVQMKPGLREVEARPSHDRLPWSSGQRLAHRGPAKSTGPQLRLVRPAFGCGVPKALAPASSHGSGQHARLIKKIKRVGPANATLPATGSAHCCTGII